MSDFSGMGNSRPKWQTTVEWAEAAEALLRKAAHHHKVVNKVAEVVNKATRNPLGNALE